MRRYLACVSVAAMLAGAPMLAHAQGAQPTLQTPDQGATTTQAPDRGATTTPAPMGAQPGASEQQQMTERPAVDLLALPPHLRASHLIGARVYSTDDKNVGDVKDLLFDNDGRIETVLIGVGGFLGIGARNIGLAVSELTITREDNKRIRVSGKFAADDVSDLPEWSDPLAPAPAAR